MSQRLPLSSLYDTLTQLLQPLQHVCIFNALNGTFNMTWQTKQIKQMISRTRQPTQTRSQIADLIVCRLKRVGQGKSFPLLYVVSLNIWNCIKHEERFSESLNSARLVCSSENQYIPLRLAISLYLLNPSLDIWPRTIEVLAEYHPYQSRYLTRFLYV